MSTPTQRPAYKVTPFGLLTAEEHDAAMASSIFTPVELADAALDLEVERVERAREWERCKEQVKQRKNMLKVSVAEGAVWSPALITLQAQRLVAALEELERLEGAGGAA